MQNTLRRKKDLGQGLVEYALVLVLVAVVVIVALMLLGPIAGDVFSTVNDSLSSVSGGVAAPTASPGCDSVYPDGYATGPGYSYQCYSPTKLAETGIGGYNLP